MYFFVAQLFKLCEHRLKTCAIGVTNCKKKPKSAPIALEQFR